MKLIHGGDIYGYASTHGGALPLDLSSNINPYGTPPRVMQAMQASLEHCAQYPDPLCRELRAAIGAAQRVPADWIFCGNGAAEILFRLAQVLHAKTVLLPAPTFAEYAQSQPHAQLRFYALSAQQDFALDGGILEHITPDLDALYLCNPNNPTGQAIAPDLLAQILLRCAKHDVYLVVDECFHDFLVDGAAHTLKGALQDHPKLILLRAFTKMYAVAGVRLGYCMSANAAIIEGLYHVGQPWNVSVVAQACGVAACQERAYAQESAQRIAAARAHLSDGLRALGLRVFPSDANFLLFQAQDTQLCEKLTQHGILVRNCENFRGLGAGYYRTAVKTTADSARLLGALESIQKEDGAWQG